MAFVLMARTRGDDLIPPSTKVVMESPDRDALEALRLKREASRAEWLAKNEQNVPEFQRCGIYAMEWVEEVPEISAA